MTDYSAKARNNITRAGVSDIKGIADFFPFLPYTMCPIERLAAVRDAVAYLKDNGIQGDFVGTGLWRGGALLYAASLGGYVNVRGYEAYGDIEPPESWEFDIWGNRCLDGWAAHCDPAGNYTGETVTPVEVAENYLNIGKVPPGRLILPRGRVQNTLAGMDLVHSPVNFAYLDTDWYRSILHSLCAIWPAMTKGGVLIVDDYGHLTGARKATDDFLATLAPGDRPMLTRIDYSARLLIKP